MHDTNWVYLKTESNLYTVGFYDPKGKWNPDSDHETSDAAALRVHFLNGGATTPDMLQAGEMALLAFDTLIGLMSREGQMPHGRRDFHEERDALRSAIAQAKAA